MSERDYYEILGLTIDADGTTVNKTYWNLARKYQALATSDPRAHGMLDELNEAYNVLGTPALRDEYDTNRPEPTSEDTSAENYSGSGREAFVAPKSREGGSARGDFAGLSRWATYAAGAALAVGGASIGVWAGNLLLAVLAGGAGAVVALAPVRHKLFGAWQKHARQAEVEESSTLSIERTHAADVAPRSPQPLSASIVRRGGVRADELRTSTASMVGRWRANAATGSESERAPDSTLVDIFRSEQEIEAQSEPLSAVLDVLRGSRSAVESR